MTDRAIAHSSDCWVVDSVEVATVGLSPGGDMEGRKEERKLVFNAESTLTKILGETFDQNTVRSRQDEGTAVQF